MSAALRGDYNDRTSKRIEMSGLMAVIDMNDHEYLNLHTLTSRVDYSVFSYPGINKYVQMKRVLARNNQISMRGETVRWLMPLEQRTESKGSYGSVIPVRFVESDIDPLLAIKTGLPKHLVHEAFIGAALSSIRSMTPNFTHVYGLVRQTVVPISTDLTGYAHQLLIDRVNGVVCRHFNFDTTSVKHMTVQILLSLAIANEHLRFHHGDMNVDNIMIESHELREHVYYTSRGVVRLMSPITVKIIDYGISVATYKKVTAQSMIGSHISSLANDVLRLVMIVNYILRHVPHDDTFWDTVRIYSNVLDRMIDVDADITQYAINFCPYPHNIGAADVLDIAEMIMPIVYEPRSQPPLQMNTVTPFRNSARLQVPATRSSALALACTTLTSSANTTLHTQTQYMNTAQSDIDKIINEVTAFNNI